MKAVFDSSYPEEQLTAEFWRDVMLEAMAEWILREMEAGRIPSPGVYDD
ncbi:hypothetical protein ACYOEI_00325 [Singulisphaera rosea]